MKSCVDTFNALRVDVFVLLNWLLELRLSPLALAQALNLAHSVA